MGKPIIIQIGATYNRLTIISEAERSNCNQRRVNVKCDCGKLKVVNLSSLMRGHTKSCGCLQREAIIKIAFKHGNSEHPLNGLWNDIKKRCYNPHSVAFHNYGGRGIKMCDKWRSSFDAFFKWAISNGWAEGLEIDRINNNGDYEPANCHFVTKHQNMMNRRVTIYLEYKGETKTMYEWAKIKGLTYKVLKDRITKLKWDVSKALENKKLLPHEHKKLLSPIPRDSI